jgi:hypothetical protein
MNNNNYFQNNFKLLKSDDSKISLVYRTAFACAMAKPLHCWSDAEVFNAMYWAKMEKN